MSKVAFGSIALRQYCLRATFLDPLDERDITLFGIVRQFLIVLLLRDAQVQVVLKLLLYGLLVEKRKSFLAEASFELALV